MNLAEMALQIYNISRTRPIIKRIKSKTNHYSNELQMIQQSFIQNNFYDPCIDELTSLVNALKINQSNMITYGHNAIRRQTILEDTARLETYIIKVIGICNACLYNHQLQRSELDLSK